MMQRREADLHDASDDARSSLCPKEVDLSLLGRLHGGDGLASTPSFLLHIAWAIGEHDLDDEQLQI